MKNKNFLLSNWENCFFLFLCFYQWFDFLWLCKNKKFQLADTWILKYICFFFCSFVKAGNYWSSNEDRLLIQLHKLFNINYVQKNEKFRNKNKLKKITKWDYKFSFLPSFANPAAWTDFKRSTTFNIFPIIKIVYICTHILLIFLSSN